MHRRTLALALVAALPFAAHAQSPSITVERAWARATTSQAGAGGAFLTLKAQGAGDRLLGASSPVARVVELHETVADQGVMRMRAVQALPIEPGTPLELKPGSYHIMLIGLTQPLRQGATFPLTLTFANAAPQTVEVKVEAAGARGPAHSH